MPGIYVDTGEGELVPVLATGYENEAELQLLLSRNPSLLLGDEPHEGSRRFLLIKQEAGVPGGSGEADRWSLDHLFVDDLGVPTLVEVKRASDTRSRREVVAQMLDYAANLSAYWPPERMREEFEARCVDSGDDPEAQVGELTGLDYEGFWTGVKTNLAARRLRLIFLNDLIPPSLRTIIEYLNEQMVNTEVLAAEVRKHEGQGLATVVAERIGDTAAARQAKSAAGASGIEWDEESFFAELATQVNEERVLVARTILDWASVRADVEVRWGFGAKTGSFSLHASSMPGSPAWIRVGTRGGVWIAWKYVRKTPPFTDPSLALDYLHRTNGALDSDLPDSTIEMTDKSIATTHMVGSKVTVFIEAQEWFLAQLVPSMGTDR